jgi:hypothetical protein
MLVDKNGAAGVRASMWHVDISAVAASIMGGKDAPTG